MHSRAVVAEALRLRDEEGLGARCVAEQMGLSIGTVRDWHAGKLPKHSLVANGRSPVPPGEICLRCGGDAPEFAALPTTYAYLLGLYLGDGCLSVHRRDVYRLRIFLDLKYPEIVEECAEAISQIVPGNKVNRLERTSNYVARDKPSNVEVSVYSKSLRCLFSQHGPGRKHHRRIWLSPWQQDLAERWPEQLLRGLIQSDGCRFINSGRGGWTNPRYSFSNLSTDITSIFCTACEKLGLRWTGAFPEDESRAVTIYVSRKADVARMDEFIGPKR